MHIYIYICKHEHSACIYITHRYTCRTPRRLQQSIASYIYIYIYICINMYVGTKTAHIYIHIYMYEYTYVSINTVHISTSRTDIHVQEGPKHRIFYPSKPGGALMASC